MRYRTCFVAIALAAGAWAQAGPARQQPVLTLEGAEAAIEAAVSYARGQQTTGAIAVVDSGGQLMALTRVDGTFPAGARIAEGKARTAALFNKPTAFFEDIVNNGRTTMVALEDFTPLQGGVPILVDGRVVGAVGVSGAASAAQDTAIAELAAQAATRTDATAVQHFPAKEVQAAFANGAALTESGVFKVHASHRREAGAAEVHTRDIDTIYVVRGEATLATGGTVPDLKSTASEELRGSRIDHGRRQTLRPGDVVVVPNGVPHQFVQVSAPFDYYVVKVRAPHEVTP